MSNKENEKKSLICGILATAIAGMVLVVYLEMTLLTKNSDLYSAFFGNWTDDIEHFMKVFRIVLGAVLCGITIPSIVLAVIGILTKCENKVGKLFSAIALAIVVLDLVLNIISMV